MALTEITYTGDGSDVTFGPIPFPYLEDSDVLITINGVATTAFTIDPSTKIITFSSAPADGTLIRVYRNTNNDTLAATFISGSAIRAVDLNDNFTQNLYVIQEIDNNAVQTDGSTTMVGDLDMGGYKVTNLAAPVAGTDAANRNFVEDSLASEFPIFYRRWSKTAAGGETSLSGNDDNGIALSYVAGSEKVFINGALQVRGIDYSGTTGTTLTGIPALIAGDIVEVHSSSNYTVGTVPDGSVTNAKVDGGAAIQSTKLAFTPSGAGAVTRSVASKLADVVSVKDFGAVGDGVTDDTAALKAAFDYAIPLGLPVRLQGTYLITGPVQTVATRASGELHIICDGDVAINVSASATGFYSVLYFHTTAQNRASIVGGDLSINGSNKAGRGITIRHDGTTGGEVTISSRLRLLNFLETSATEIGENEALSVFGDYSRVVIEQPFVSGVARTNTSAGACKGISISQFSGEVTINQPYVENVLVPSLSSFDADGIATFGKAIGTTYNSRPGKVTINQPTFVDCQGRSFKSQCSDCTVIRPEVRRKNYVSITQCVEFDFQFGNGLVIEPVYEYRLNGATSPLGASHSCVAFQQVLDNATMCGKSIGGVLLTEVIVPRYAGVFHQSGSLYSHTEVSGLRVIPIGGLTTNAIDRAIIETDMSTVVAKTAKTRLVVDNISGPIQCRVIGYTSYTSGSLAAKLSWSVQNCTNTLAVVSASRPFAEISGSGVTEVESFIMRNNQGFRNIFSSGWTFTFNKLVPGCLFTADISGVVATGAPGWGASGYALVEVLDCWFGATDKMIRVTVGNAAAANTVFYTQDGGTTWGTIK
jgi:hypothetical protein